MTDDEIKAGLIECAVAIRAGIDDFRREHAERTEFARQRGWNPPKAESMRDVNGRPILAEMYVELGRVLVALKDYQ